ncbi:DnaB-like helicase N-terminal domain-containing protein [Streptomyces ipomoeae]|nr:DnaB-like helicase N-terminal domain-containing protein [Streptomyces ipomoeae]MDX2821582.1 DnaB-like helicase N-terminal domain-containing protein [Streptomyces ipomoeae]MDX2879403.1 DnaB-like helicase N-terminal domain-containing protein [Streptomyces ipomoeae]
MPRTPSPDEDDDLDRIPAPKPVHYAEQALLGALLLEPHRLADTHPIKAGHFESHTHAALFTAIQALTPPEHAEHATKPAWLNMVLDKARPHAPGLSASYLHSLVQFCPNPKHAAAYARMIRADHARRALRLHAERLAAAATDPTLPHPADTVLARADALGRLLDDLAGQYAPHSNPLPRTSPPATSVRQASEEDLDEERDLLASATAMPAEVRHMRWLAPNDFVLPLHAALWQCLTTLVHRGDVVDPVTVLGEAQHHGLITDTLTPRDVMAHISTPAGSPEYWGERVLQRALLSRAHQVAETITAYTDDPANTPHQLITGSRRALADLHILRTRWHRATAPAPSPTARTTARLSAPSARAGPSTRPPAHVRR